MKIYGKDGRKNIRKDDRSDSRKNIRKNSRNANRKNHGKKIICTAILLDICMLLSACRGETPTEEMAESANAIWDSISFGHEEDLPFQVTDNRSGRETVYYKSPSDFIEDCGFEEEEPFWEYAVEKDMDKGTERDTEKDSVQLVLYYDEASGEGCGVRYYPDEENKSEAGFRFCRRKDEKLRYSIMEAWADLAWESTLSCKRNTGKTFVSGYEESKEYFQVYPRHINHFESKGIVEKDGDGTPASLVEIDWTYRADDTLQKREYRHNPQVFGTYRSSAEYYYNWGETGKGEKLLYQKFWTDRGGGEVYYIYGEDEMFPEFYLYMEQNMGAIEVQLVSYDTEIPDEDKLNLDEEMILAQYPVTRPFHADVDHYDDEGNPVVHLYEVVVNEDESHTATADWISVNPDTGIGVTFWNEIVDIIHDEEKIWYLKFLKGELEAAGTSTDSREILDYYYESGSLPCAYVDLNDDGIEELIIYPYGIFMQILTLDRGNVLWVGAPFYSGATGEIINTNKEVVMVDESHAGRNQYSVYRMNDEKELEAVIFFQVWFGGESGLEEDVYSQYIGGMEEGTEEVITKEEFDKLYERYVQNELDIEWKKSVR